MIIDLMSGRKKNAPTVVFTIGAFKIIVWDLVLLLDRRQ
jgi:hypothetical protein